MKENIHNWLSEKMRVAGILACGIRSPDRKTFTRSLSPQFAPVALENACRCLSDTFQILNSNRFPIELVRWVYDKYFVYGFVRQDGHCLAVFTRRHEHSMQASDLEAIVAEFHSLTT
jgi:hypothetical protein